ncbi:MAG: cytochrome P450 [Acidobacteriota bacterium]
MSALPAPPEPSLTRFQQTLRFMKDPYGFLAQTRAECGEVFTLRPWGMGRWVFLCNAEVLGELYKLPEDQVLAGEIRKRIVAYLFGSRASISLDGAEYAQRRKIVMPFFGGRKVFQHTDLIHRLTEEKLLQWPLGELVRLQPYLNDIALESAGRILFGPLEQDPAAQLVPYAKQFLIALQPPAVQARPLQWNLGRFSAYGRFVIARDNLYRVLDGVVRTIEERRASQAADEEPKDVLSALVAADLYDNPDECREAIVHEMVAFIVGGAETTSKVLAWTLLGVLSNPKILDRLRHELDEVLGGQPIKTEHLRQLPYLHAVIQEGMRFQSVGPFAGPRLAKKDITIGGFTIAAGTPIAQCLQEVGRTNFFPNPEQFDPENFLGRKVRTNDWVPFGGGSRLCTGMGLAQLELAVVVGTLIQRLDLELGPGSTEPARSGIAFQPANELAVIVRGRRT